MTPLGFVIPPNLKSRTSKSRLFWGSQDLMSAFTSLLPYTFQICVNPVTNSLRYTGKSFQADCAVLAAAEMEDEYDPKQLDTAYLLGCGRKRASEY